MPFEAQHSASETDLHPGNITTLEQFVDSLPASKQGTVRFWCLDVGHERIDTKLANLKKELTVEQLATCRRLLEKEGSDFKKFLPSTQHSIVDQMIKNREFVSVKELIIKADVPKAFEAFENYLKYNQIEIGGVFSEEEGNNKDKGRSELKMMKSVSNEKQKSDEVVSLEKNKSLSSSIWSLPDLSISRSSLAEDRSQQNNASPFPFLENADPDTIKAIHNAISIRTSGKSKVVDLAISLFLNNSPNKNNKPAYEQWKKELYSQGVKNLEEVLGIAQEMLQAFKEAKGSSATLNSPPHGEVDNIKTTDIQQPQDTVIEQNNDNPLLNDILANCDTESTQEPPPEPQNDVFVDIAPVKKARNAYFSFLDGEDDETIDFVHKTIRDSSLASKKKDEYIYNCLSEENRQKYQLFKEGLIKTISKDFISMNRLKSIRLKKLLTVYGSSKALNSFYLLDEEGRALEVAMATINKTLQKFMKEGHLKSSNEDNNKQLVLYRGKDNKISKKLRKKKKKYNFFRRVWKWTMGAMTGFAKYFRPSCISRNKVSSSSATRGGAVFCRSLVASSSQGQKMIT